MMDYENKYLEALERAKNLRKDAIDMGENIRAKQCEIIFPELKESDDERIRKWLICGMNALKEQKNETFATIPIDDAIAWLEKQGESNPYSGVSFKYNGHIWGMCARDNGVEILVDGHIKGRVFTDDNNAKEMFIKALERVEEQNAKGYKLTDCDKNSWWEDFKAYTSCTIEQKPADMVEPKFHEGEWIVYNGDVYHIGNIALKRYYECLRVDGTIHTFGFSIDNKSHTWTIQDAKDGDVLAGKIDGDYYILIFKQIKDGWIETYGHYYDAVDRFCVPSQLFCRDYQGTFTPATKEQRDTLFAKMKEADYKWDAEKKELTHIDARENLTLDGDLMEADCMVVEQTSSWSEEDERAVGIIKIALKHPYDMEDKWNRKFALDWLKSLKERVGCEVNCTTKWKPSGEQMHYLSWIANVKLGDSVVEQEVSKHLNELYNDLKKLMEE